MFDPQVDSEWLDLEKDKKKKVNEKQLDGGIFFLFLKLIDLYIFGGINPPR